VIDTLFKIDSVVSLLIFVLGIVLMGFIPYLLGYRLFGRTADGKTKEVATLLFRASGILLGLMLSMNFASVRTEYVKIQDSVELEAKEIGELTGDFKRFGGDDATELQSKLLAYVKVVIDDEWPSLAKDSPSQKAQELFLEIEDGILSLKPETQYQQNLKARLMIDIDEISDTRAARIYGGNVSLKWFIAVILIGFLLSNFLLCVNPLRLSTLIFISCYSTFIGIVLYSIMALNQPYQGIIHVSVKPFQTVYNTLSSQPSQSLSD
jgi:hypothetical protein